MSDTNELEKKPEVKSYGYTYEVTTKKMQTAEFFEVDDFDYDLTAGQCFKKIREMLAVKYPDVHQVKVTSIGQVS